MTTFWVVAGIFIVAALLFVIPALLRNNRKDLDKIEREAANISIYRDQIAELDQDLRNDILSKEQYESSKQELQKRMLQDLSTSSETASTPRASRHGIAATVIVVLAVPLTAVYLYTIIGDSRGLLPQSQLANATHFQSDNAESVPPGHAEIQSIIDNLAARLKDNPEDIEGWVMLARTYAIMGRFEDASATYAELVKIIPDSPQFLSDYADVLAMTNDGSLVGKPAELIAQALALDPDYPKALALAGTVEFERGKFEQAAIHWQRLLEIIPAESQLAQSINESIVQAKALASRVKDGSGPLQLAQNSNIGSDLPTVESDKAEAAAEPTPAPSSSGLPSISGSVTLDASLRERVSLADTLFVFARAKEGPKMPLAILRVQAKDLPVTFTLDDGMAMTPAMKLSSFPEVVIGARISRTGQAVPASGDLEGYSQPVKIGDKDVTVVIDRIVP
ncbi:c-type cytochrome biogenesis protein CcmI [Nitrosomonas halophila]|uniref:Cytochrome c-type biogenesis protein CcmH n=1 Tax=Nitrosomonas halophila TaxID=44576 RepID=A0A1H3IDA2_9PROT|nr:c-type cytochrome biogenesis protein CcmI [Nitrosomonas halophila]SDY25833.1 cytochrome c-type biogenesis protein CcmH [Nitrosomonas halophila]